MANPAKARSLSEFAAKYLGAQPKKLSPKYADIRKNKKRA
jgi:hypothetical protein